MDKYEYKLKLEQIRNLVEARDYKSAALIAEGINWKKVKSVSTLCLIGEIYENTNRLEESREILLMAYDRSPVGRNIIYRLTHVAIKLRSLEEAQEYYEEFLEIAPHDNMKYVLKYEIARAKGAPLEDLISILEEFKEREYTEEWAFELAYLYHKNGNAEKCVDICDELILWFGEGKYVERALELKMLYQPLNKLQEDKYRRFKLKKEGVVEVSPMDNLKSGEILGDTVKIPSIQSDTGRFNTMNLQAELAKSMQQIIDATEQGTVSDTINNIKRMVGEMPHYQDTQPIGEPIEPEADNQWQEPESEADNQWQYQESEVDNQWQYQESEADNQWQEPEAEPLDGGLDIDFRGILAEEYDGQISLRVPETPRQDLQITGQMSIEDILAEWERTKEAARAAMVEAEQRKLEEAKVKALKEAESLMERLTGSLPTEEELAEAVAAMMSQEGAAPVEQEISVMEAEVEAVFVAPIQEIPAIEEPEPMEEAALPREEVKPEPETTETDNETARGEESLARRILRQQRQQQKALEEELRKEQMLQQKALEEKLRRERMLQQKTLEEEQRKERMPTQKTPLEKVPKEERPLTSLSDEQKQIFSYFTLISGMEGQLCQALEGARQRKRGSRDSLAGNLIITGGKGSGKTVLATDFVKAYQKLSGHTGGKVGKISASVLNQKDAAKLFETLEGGCLIIERAGDLSRESVENLSSLMEKDTKGLLVVLEGDQDGIKKAMSRDNNFARKFTEQICIPVFTSDELVAFAKAYARENNCEIEDMGVLALYNCISNIQKLDEATTLTEVKEIMDDAIYRANRGGLKKLFGKRNTEQGLVLIKEKDFDI